MRWINLRLSLITTLVICITALMVIVLPEHVQPAYAGLAIVYAAQVLYSLGYHQSGIVLGWVPCLCTQGSAKRHSCKWHSVTCISALANSVLSQVILMILRFCQIFLDGHSDKCLFAALGRVITQTDHLDECWLVALMLVPFLKLHLVECKNQSLIQVISLTVIYKYIPHLCKCTIHTFNIYQNTNSILQSWKGHISQGARPPFFQ